MDRVALVAALFLSLLIGVNGSLRTPPVFARKGYSPKLGAVAGLIAGVGGGMLVAVLLLAVVGNGVVGALGGVVGAVAGLAALWTLLPDRIGTHGTLPDGKELALNIEARHVGGNISRGLFIASVVVALLALATLLWTIANKSIGLTAMEYAVEPGDLLVNGAPTGREVSDLSDDELTQVLAENERIARLRVYILTNLSGAAQEDWSVLSAKPVNEVLDKEQYPDELGDTLFNQLTETEAAGILTHAMDREQVETLIMDEIVQSQVTGSWSLWESLTDRDGIEATVAEKTPNATLEWHSWLTWDFISSPLDPRRADATGLRPALYGSLMIIAITILVAFPVGVGAAIYLEEYAGSNWLNRIIQTNIANLAGVPSIIYGMLGLAIFVRSMESLTSGNVFGSNTANGRTIFSAGFTLALLILPLIIINAQEAIRAVPNSLRQASYGLGATKWQTIWNHVLPYSLPGIMTGTILAISRAIGETAPLILVGAATYITQDPKGPFSNFTALPMIIYRWTTLPQTEFRNAAAAAIVVLLVLLLTMNSIAVVLRNRFSRRLT
ncbi:phosphate ABC transporter permease PstA [Aggregatilinea lenta]|uniref:phosphate ABC transporter permease PstA n=1 Tax=Aggregatilinea lenta TaxID=913108 RepID=UPI001EE7C297|nr:phosphate ABC transporter permease PstA [Aggregatilinea lenta]